MPEVSHRWLDELWVYENMPHALPGHVLAELESEVLHIFAAKQGKVPLKSLLKEGEDIIAQASWAAGRADGIASLRSG